MRLAVSLALTSLFVTSSWLGLLGSNGPTEGATMSSHPARATHRVDTADAPSRIEPVLARDPAHLRLWKFDAPVIPVHLHGTELVPPSDPSTLGWWGQPAGAAHGTTLLVGHTVHTGGGMLDDLEDTPVGRVADVSGVRYRVTSVKVVTKTRLAQRAQQLFAPSGRPKLVLVTCEGYDRHTGLYADNVVVVATPLPA